MAQPEHQQTNLELDAVLTPQGVRSSVGSSRPWYFLALGMRHHDFV